MAIKVLVVGAGGYGNVYMQALMEHIDEGKYELGGVVEIRIEGSPYKDELEKRGIPVYKTMEEYYAEHEADLAIISTPIFLHAKQSIYALEHGTNVLCEKPIASSYEDAMAMCEAAKRTGKFLAIGYQFCYTTGIGNLKKDIMQGLLGKPKKLKTLVHFPRGWWYYNSRWTGHIKDANGNLILDSVISNATAHYLNNMLYLLGEDMQKAVLPDKCTAEILRANDIENYDTAVLRMETKDGAEIMMFASHAVKDEIRPIFDFEFENAKVTFSLHHDLIAEFNDGTVKNYGYPLTENDNLKKLWDVLDIMTGGNVAQLPCVGESAVPHNILINNIYEQCEIQNVPAEYIIVDEEEGCTRVAGLDEMLVACFEQGRLLSEMGHDWVKKNDFIMDRKGYDSLF